MSKFVGIDVGGTKIAAVILDAEAMTYGEQMVIRTEARQGPDAVLERIAGLTRDICQNQGVPWDDVGGVGVGLPATIDLDAGTTLLMPNLAGNWHGKPVVSQVSGLLGVPVSLINDARAFTLAEAMLGAGRGSYTVAGLTLGTGIGGGIAINGRLHLGLGASAGEFGHHSINFLGPPDGSGNPGGWEAYCSGPAIAAAGIKAVIQGITTNIGELVEYDLNRITPEVIMRAAASGDAIARAILEEAGELIGAGIANVVTILAPDCVVIGGGVARLGKWIMEPMRRSVEARVHTVPLDKLRIVPAELGPEAGAVGAALIASQHV
jgi:glucokinase